MKLKQKAVNTFESRHFTVFITVDAAGRKIWTLSQKDDNPRLITEPLVFPRETGWFTLARRKVDYYEYLHQWRRNPERLGIAERGI